jgi:methylated-DNA-[protein]-cysteine S-methyltransferase
MQRETQRQTGMKQPARLRGGRIATPLGDLTALVDRAGRLTRLAFPEEVQSYRWRVDEGDIDWDQDSVAPVAAQIRAYFTGSRRRFTLDLAPAGTVFQQSVWTALQQIPFGITLTYGQLAQQLGSPNAARAVGAANGANPISLIIPCHRLIASSGDLIRYAGGLAVKRALLQLEGALPRTGPAASS